MQDKDFNSCLLFYPAVMGDVKIPDGVPVGSAICLIYSRAYQSECSDMLTALEIAFLGTC